MEIITQENGLQNSKKNDDNSLKIIIEKELEEHGGGTLEEYLAKGLIRITQKAEKPDIKGILQEDFEVKLKAYNTLHKILNPKIGQSNINIGFFTPPGSGPLKY